MLRKSSPTPPDGSALLARVLWRSATARLENKDNAAALQELEQAVAMAEKTLPAEHADLKRFRETLAKCKATMAGEAEQANPDADTGGG
jgi:CRISPR/Cas system type I-B associated protein Csh2 (Cas7 group RAMP superfamily)